MVLLVRLMQMEALIPHISKFNTQLAKVLSKN